MNEKIKELLSAEKLDLEKINESIKELVDQEKKSAVSATLSRKDLITKDELEKKENEWNSKYEIVSKENQEFKTEAFKNNLMKKLKSTGAKKPEVILDNFSFNSSKTPEDIDNQILKIKNEMPELFNQSSGGINITHENKDSKKEITAKYTITSEGGKVY